MSFVTILLVISALLFFYKLFSPGGKLVTYGEKIPGPKAYPLIGNALSFVTKKPFLLVLSELGATYGSLFRLWMGKQLFVVLSDPDDIKVILTSTDKHLDKSDSYRYIDSWVGNTNVISCNGDVWKPRRELLEPSFNLKMLENSVGMITRNAEILADQLRIHLNQPDFNIESYIEKCTLDTLCESITGIKLETQLSEKAQFLDSLNIMTEMFMKRIFNPMLHPELLFKISATGRAYYKNLKIVRAEGRKVIEQRKKFLEQNKNMSLISEEEGRKISQPLLDFLLTRSNFSQAEIENEVHVFMFAGNKTVESTISFCLYSLSQNEDVQKKLYEEIRTTFIEKKGNLSYQDYANMKYLKCVIKETLRLYSSIPLIARKISEDVQLPSGYTLPAGALASLSFFDLHRKKHLFPDPEKFLPERFEKRDSSRNPFAYVPFAAGPRNCLGKGFALIETKIVISKLLLQYQFLPAIRTRPLILDNRLVTRSLHKLPLRIKQRSLETI